MITRMKITKALRVCERGPGTEAQRTAALASLRRFSREIKRDYPEVSTGVRVNVEGAVAALKAADLRGAG